MKKSLSWYPISIWALLSISQVQAEMCTPPRLESNLNLSLPCVSLRGNNYAVKLNFDNTGGGGYNWRLDPDIKPASCEWNVNACVTLNETFNLALPNLDIGGKKHIAYLGYNPSPSTENWTWTYKSHFPVVSRAGGGEDGSSSYGTLAPFTEPTPVDGSGKTLLLWYMVGSDLESNGGAGTTDFNEMLKAYQNLGGTPQLDVLIAFGGAAKEGWQGVKFATAQQVINDGADGVYGNSNDYLYTESRAHMGDQSTFTAFLKYAQQGYQNYDRRVLMMWDHGGSFRGFGNDNNFGMNGLQLNEIANSLQNSGIGKLDMIGFDACLMASAEVAKTIAPYAHYLLASEETEPGHGWNWTHVITQFASNMDLVAIGKSVADNFVDSQSHPSKQDGKTLSLLDLSQAGSVKAKLDTFARNLTQRLQSGDSQAREAFIHASKEVRFYADKDRNKAKDAGYGHDLGHFLELFVARTPDASATELLQAVKNFVLHSVHDGTRPNSNGVFLHSFDAKPPSKLRLILMGLKLGNSHPCQKRYGSLKILGKNIWRVT